MGKGFLPTPAKLDETDAYYNLPCENPLQNKAAIYNPKEKAWIRFLCKSITFGNRHSAAEFQSVSLLIANSLSTIFGIIAIPYIDDFVILCPPGMEIEHFNVA